MSDYALSFAWSRSPRYARAVALAGRVPGTTVTGDARAATHHVPIGPAVAELSELLGLVAGWQTTCVRHAGRPLPRRAVAALQQVLTCAQEREWSGLGALHCQGRDQAWDQRLPCRVLDRAVPDRVLAEADPDQRAALVRGLARTSLAAACPVFDATAVRAAAAQARAPQPAERQGWRVDLTLPDPTGERARFERLLGDLELD